MPRRARQAAVAGQKRDAEIFRESNVDRVVSSDVGPKLPDPGQEKIVRITEWLEIRQMRQRLLRTRNGNSAAKNETAQHLRDLNIEEMRHVDRLLGLENARLDNVCKWRSD